MPAVNPENQVASLDIGDSQLELSWHDGHVSRYPASWLLEACDCDTCGDTRSAVRHTRLVDKPQRPAILIATHDTDSLRIDWGNGHLSCYSLPWLRYHCLSPAGRAKRKFKPSCWGDEMATNLPYMDYTEVAASDDLQLQFLESILHKGFAVLRGVPAAREHTEEITSLVGKLRLTNYEVYELESKPVPEIVGDMSLALAPHTDEPYRVDPPAITFFHVIAQSRDGGASTLVDGFRLAQLLRQQEPEAFEILSSISAGFHRHLREGRIFAYQHPIIQLDSDGDVTALRLLDRAMTPVDCKPDQVEPFYDALRKLLRLSYSGEGMIEFRLEAGEMLVFNNQRLMHGRSAFDPASGKRHIRSCHVDLDEFYSSLRILYAEREDPRRWMTFRKD